MSEKLTMIFDCIAAHHELEAIGRESDRRIAATFQAMGTAKPSAYDVYIRASQFPYHQEMVSSVRTAIRQPLDTGLELIEESWGWQMDPFESPAVDAVTDLHLQGSQDKLPRTVGETIGAYPGAMFLRGRFTATITLQARLLMATWHRLGAPQPLTRVLVATDLLTVEFAGAELDAELLRSGDLIRFTVQLPDHPCPTWAWVERSEILRTPFTP